MTRQTCSLTVVLSRYTDLHNIIMSISNAVLREGAPSTLAFSSFTCIQRFLWIFSEPFSDIMHHPYF